MALVEVAAAWSAANEDPAAVALVEIAAAWSAANEDAAALLPALKPDAVQAEHVAPALAEPAVKYWPAGQLW